VHKNKPTASNVRGHTKPIVLTEQADAETHSSHKERQSGFDSAVEEILEDFVSQVLQDVVFSPAQMSAIQETVSTSVNEALWVFNKKEA